MYYHKKYEEAIKYFDKALEIDPDYKNAKTLLQECQEKINKQKKKKK